MKLQQLRSLCEIVDQGFNVSRAASALNTSQPGISAQLRILEQELGVVLLERRSTKIIGLSEAGMAMLPAARRILFEAEQMRRKAREVQRSEASKRLVIGTTHTHANYTVLPTFRKFTKDNPKIVLQLRQSSPTQIAQMVATGEVDIGIASEPITKALGVSYVPCFKLEHGVIVPRQHPLLRLNKLRLEDLIEFPIITYDSTYRLGRLVRERFRANGLEPNIAINATDSHTTKAYVEAGLGIAILPELVFEPARDLGLNLIPAHHLFEATICFVMTLEGRRLEKFQQDFIAQLRNLSPSRPGARQIRLKRA
jgi:LysR family cys regulon transcriptional activator